MCILCLMANLKALLMCVDTSRNKLELFNASFPLAKFPMMLYAPQIAAITSSCSACLAAITEVKISCSSLTDFNQLQVATNSDFDDFNEAFATGNSALQRFNYSDAAPTATPASETSLVLKAISVLHLVSYSACNLDYPAYSFLAAVDNESILFNTLSAGEEKAKVTATNATRNTAVYLILIWIFKFF